MFYDNKYAFEYNMSRLQTLELPNLLNYERAITVRKRRKNIPKKQMAYIPVYTLRRELI